jgi:saccharopine dehydrogenase-like NADP-dependent oxidoreductase
MKVALTGAAGIQGMSAMIYLLDQRDVSEIRASDVQDFDRLKTRAQKLGDPRLRVHQLDCTDEDAATSHFEGCDVVINSAMIRGHFIKTTRAALNAGANYLDMTSLGEEPQQLALHDKFVDRGTTCIVDMGTAPGLSNIMAVHCMNRLDRTETIDFAWGVIDTISPDQHSRPLYWGYGFDGIMGLISGPSLVYENGQVMELEPRARPAVFRFKVGDYVMKGMRHKEPAMLAASFPDAGFKHIMYRQAFDPDSDKKYEFLRDLGFASHDPIDVKGVRVAPFDVLWAMLQALPPEKKSPAHIVSEGNCIATGWKNGRNVEVKLMIRTAPDSEMHRHYTSRGALGSYRTGINAAIAGVMLGRGEISKKGAYRPELAVPAERYIEEQVRVGMEVEETIRSIY